MSNNKKESQTKNTNMSKTKQQWLDLENPTPSEWITQQLLIQCSKTELEQLKRMYNRMAKILYKTQAKQTSFETIRECIEYCVIVNDEEQSNKMEN